MQSNKLNKVFGILRISIGLIFLWAFFDKVFGLGFATTPDKSWLVGGSPTAGFLQAGVHGPFAGFYHSLAGSGLVDWLFMLGLLFIGVTLTFGVFMKLGSWAGMLMLFLMYTAVGIQPANHPFIDEHFIYFFTIMALMMADAGKYYGFGNQWASSSFVQKYPIFK